MTEAVSNVRVPPVRPPLSDEQSTLLRRMTVPAGKEDDPAYQDFAERAPAIFGMLVQNPGLGELVTHIRTFAHSGSGLPIRDRELLIHRVTARLGAEYEWSMHAAILGPSIGLDQETIDATATAAGSDPRWSEGDALIIDLVDELIDTNEVGDELWSALSSRYDTPALLSLLFITGIYTAYSWMGNSLRLQREPGTPPFPQNR